MGNSQDKFENDFRLFKENMAWWTVALATGNWDIRFGKSDKINGGDNAHVILSYDGRKAYATLSRRWESNIYEIDELAIHESLEIFFADLAAKLETVYAREVVEDEIHKVINVLVPLLREYRALNQKCNELSKILYNH